MNPTVQELVAALTLEEKAGLCSGADFWHTKAVERLGIPAIKVSDGPHGLRTQKEGSTDPNDAIEAVCFPAGCAAAASFDPALTRRMGAALGREARASGVQVLLGPAVNIKRSPLCGRNFEYYSEDPLVSGKMAAAMTRGVQAHKGCGTTIKHYAANNKEYNRYRNNSIVSERAMREIYLKGFGICVREAQPKAVMTSYNLLNGTHTAESRGLIMDILRAEFGYEGIVMTDWVTPMADTRSAHRDSQAQYVAAAGGDLFMPGNKGDYDNLLQGIDSGAVSLEQVKINASRVVRMARALAQE